jgi:phospholipase/carboxylesterase
MPRAFLLLLAGLTGCAFPSAESGGGSARLVARPGVPTSAIAPGLTPLGSASAPQGYLLVPAGYDPAHPLPLVLALHGAGIGASGPLSFFGPYVDEHNFILLAVSSRDYTWDAILGPYGPDVAFIDQALRFAFERCAVDPARVFVEGFSDGASYALGLGLANGDLFSRVVAFSPGFIPPSGSPRVGAPVFFLSHGREDPVLPIDNASRRIVPALQAEGYTVTYVEYDGVHSVPANIALQAVLWLIAP